MSETRRTDDDRAGGRLVLLVVAGLALLLGAAWAALYLVSSDRVPRGTTVAGVAIGGLDEAGAVDALRTGLAARTGQALQVSAGAASEQVDPAALGLSVDLEASVSEAGGGRSWRPQRIWDYFTGGRELPAVVDVEAAALGAEVQRLAATAGQPARDGVVRFADGRVQTRSARVGTAVDPDRAEQALRAAWPPAGDGQAQVELPVEQVQPDIDQGDVDRAVTELADPAVSAPVTLLLGATPVVLQPAEVTTVLSTAAQDGALVLQVDTPALQALVAARGPAEGAPVDATVALVDGRPQVVRGRAGTTAAPEALTSALLSVLTAPEGQREAAVEQTRVSPAFRTRDARALQIDEQVSTFTTSYPYAEYRNTNIGRAAELIDGTVLRPGETFSLNDTVGERTRENGFTEGFVISNGIFAEELGGGVSQMATTLFNAMFFAGLEDVEHKPHSFYIDRYPVGREATVAWGAIDLRFRNDTPWGVLVDTSLSPGSPGRAGSITVTLWSTKVWDITTTTSARYNPTQPETRTLDTEDCYPNRGYGGFDVDVVRYFRQPGQQALEREERFTTTYTPSDTVVCRPPGSLTR